MNLSISKNTHSLSFPSKMRFDWSGLEKGAHSVYENEDKSYRKIVVYCITTK